MVRRTFLLVVQSRRGLILIQTADRPVGYGMRSSPLAPPRGGHARPAWRLAVTSTRAAAAVVRAVPVAQQFVGDARRHGVDRVVEGVDRDLPRRPEDGRRGDVPGRQYHQRAAPNA